MDYRRWLVCNLGSFPGEIRNWPAYTESKGKARGKIEAGHFHIGT